MLNLESSAWSKYAHAYGEASDIPGLLSQLSQYPSKSDYRSEPFFSLWSALCHQGDTCAAAYAAVPHILSLAAREPSKISDDFLLLPTLIEIARLRGRGPEIPIELRDEYHSAIRSMSRIVANLDTANLDGNWIICCAAAVAVTAGHVDVVEAILELNADAARQFLDWKSSL